MKIIDCFMYFNEDLIADLRFHQLNEFVDKFIVVESKFTHSGEEKAFNFNIDNFSKFKDKIIYLSLETKPENLIEIYQDNSNDDIRKKQIENALIIENHQRNYISNGIESFSDNDFILISDIDELPDIENANIALNKKKLILFKQFFFHYKFNLYLKDFFFYGSKGCLKKNLKSPQWLRNIKNKKYSKLRIDAYFSKKKSTNIHIVENGGWHFTNIMNEEKIIYKLKSYLHHADFPENLLSKEIFKKLIDEKKMMYDHSADKGKDRFANKKQLEKFEFSLLPKYIKDNKNKYKDWLI